MPLSRKSWLTSAGRRSTRSRRCSCHLRNDPVAMIPPGAWLGLLGGGQLGRMFTMAAQSMGYRVVVLDPGSDSPAGSVADEHIAADYVDPAALEQLASRCAAATTEFENVPAEAL